ncbi:proline--tRNA ligase [Candidatus Woesearchaeota archaeon]|jgi:prolyl-tRNA synthetase|nr:proline--tRNA ligase [Candidatus Woesearchaeota archaeon]MBT5739650.1 proline--tRNA ligase [Candidatus Woesearchaeota archaeon]
MAKDTKGITAKKAENFSEWYTQVIQKAELIEYSPVSGCYILRPNAYHIWEKVQEFFNKLIKEHGVKNAYFPLFIPESLLNKEEDHVEGFAPEVAWVETGGKTKLKERLAVRPTSETIMYDAYSKWIRSHNDLPLKLNQWCNVVRWEFKHCTPFLRSREFLWQEGHNVFATEKEVQEDTLTILDFYEKMFEELYAIPTLKGRKSESEKFAGAYSTYSVEILLPNNKAIQGATSHNLGQNFAKAFDISFTDKDEKKQLAWQNSWGISTRSIGAMIIMHSDDKGLVLPPRVAPVQAVIIPIIFEKTKEQVLKAAKKLQTALKKSGIEVELDAREQYSPGWKFNQWEMKGTPLRIELGPRDLEKDQAVVARRDTGEKKAIPLKSLPNEAKNLLEDLHNSLLKKAKDYLSNSIVQVTTKKEAEKAIKENKIILAPWSGTEESEKEFKEKTGAQSLNSPSKQPTLKDKKCFLTGKEAKYWFYFGKSY